MKNNIETETDLKADTELQGSAKEWSLGCVIPVSWHPLAAGAHFTQPRNLSLADQCRYIRELSVWKSTHNSSSFPPFFLSLLPTDSPTPSLSD